MKKILYIESVAFLLLMTGCKTVDFNKTTPVLEEVLDESVKNLEDEQKEKDYFNYCNTISNDDSYRCILCLLAFNF